MQVELSYNLIENIRWGFRHIASGDNPGAANVARHMLAEFESQVFQAAPTPEEIERQVRATEARIVAEMGPLAEVEGNVTITGGVATLPDGTAINLHGIASKDALRECQHEWVRATKHRRLHCFKCGTDAAG